MTFLKKLGQILLNGLEIVSGIMPILKTAYPGAAGEVQTVSNDLAQVAQIIVQVEAAGQAIQAPGAQKLTMAVGPVSQIVLQSSLLVGHQIANPTLFTQGCTDLANAMAEILNSLSASSLQTTSPVVANATATSTSTTATPA